MELENLTLKEISKLLTLLNSSASKPMPFNVGEEWFFRTVTHYLTGRITAIHGDFLTLEQAAWIADTGRFANALRTHEFNEVEPMGDCVVLNASTIIDAVRWTGVLPTVQK